MEDHAGAGAKCGHEVAAGEQLRYTALRFGFQGPRIGWGPAGRSELRLVDLLVGSHLFCEDATATVGSTRIGMSR